MSDWKEVSAESSETWDKKEPLVGLLIEKKENVGDNNSRLYIVETPKGNMSLWGSAVIDNKFASIQVGQEVKVEFLGKETNPKTKREYNNYKVYSRELPFKEVDNTVNEPF